MVERKLLALKSTANGQRAFLTAEGLQELSAVFKNARFMNIDDFGDLHLQLDLGSRGEALESPAMPTAPHKRTP